MVARAYWSGQIRLALVSIAVEIYAATKGGASVPFHQIHEPSGKRIRYEKVVPGLGPVDPEDIVKGYEYEKGQYVLLEQEEIDAVKMESKRTLVLKQFVDPDEIEVLYFEKPYYVVPADDLAQEAFVVLRDALRQTKKVGLGQLALRGRKVIVSLKPCGRGIVLETLRYADEVTKANTFFREIDDIKPDPELLELATALIEKKTAPFEPDAFADHYADALERLIAKKKKARGKLVIEESEARQKGSNVIDLMAALKRSLGPQTERADSGKRKTAPSRSTRKAGASPAKGKSAAPKQTRKSG